MQGGRCGPDLDRLRRDLAQPDPRLAGADLHVFEDLVACEQFDGRADGPFDRVSAGDAGEHLADHRGDRAAVTHADRGGPGQLHGGVAQPGDGLADPHGGAGFGQLSFGLGFQPGTQQLVRDAATGPGQVADAGQEPARRRLIGPELGQQRVQVLAGQLLQARGSRW